MASGDIVVNMIGQNSLSPAVGAAVGSFGRLNVAMDTHIGKLVAETRAQAAFSRMLDETHKEQARGIAISLRARGAIGQLIFAVDDAATVYGQHGLAGSIRAAGNNLTMAASMMGPWAAAISVGVMAAVQLGMALSKTGEEADKSRGMLDKFREQIEAIEKIANRIGQKRTLIDVRGMNATDAEIKRTDLRDESVRLEKQQVFLWNSIKDLEQQREQFAINNSQTPTTDVLGGLSKTDRERFDEMGRDLDKLRERRRDVLDEKSRVNRDETRLERALPGIRERERQDFQSQQDQADLRKSRAAREADETARAMSGSLRRELMKGDIDPGQALLGRKQDAASDFLRRESEINALGNVDPVLRQQMLADAQAIAVQQMTRLDRDKGAGLSGRGPATLRSGDAETLRFLNQARLGATAKSTEAKELEKLNQTNREMLAAMRQQKQAADSADPVVVVDF